MLVKPQDGGYTDVVYIVFWTITDTDGMNTAGRAGQIELSPPVGSFTPYADLTETQVLGWIQAALGTAEVNAIEADLNIQILYMQQPPVTSPPLPWA